MLVRDIADSAAAAILKSYFGRAILKFYGGGRSCRNCLAQDETSFCERDAGERLDVGCRMQDT